MGKHETWYSSILNFGDRLAQVFVVFFTPSNQMSEVYMKLSHRRFLFAVPKSLFTNHRIL